MSHSLQTIFLNSSLGLIAIALFVIAYLLVMAEEFIQLRKSKPVILCAGIIWAMVAYLAKQHHLSAEIEHLFKENLLEYAELMLFLLVAMTYINVMDERQVFAALRAKLVSMNLSYRQLFWVSSSLAFFLSAWADNLTTALFMSAVIIAIERENLRFVSLCCIAIVVAANAGGAYSPFGDITSLMVWQKGLLDFFEFFKLFIPSAINYLIPASLMLFAVPAGKPQASEEKINMKTGAKRTIFLFICTIILAVLSHLYLHMPPVLGMMTGLACLQFFGYYLKKQQQQAVDFASPFDIFTPIARAEWDTLLFFYGVMMCVGGLATFGYLNSLSHYLFTELGQNLSAGYQALPANIIIGVLSALVDNIPVMYAVLTMQPDMPLGQWLLVTLTTGTGGSLLAIGSAAGVALLGQARGCYTFFSHLKWSWAILLGYLASIASLLWLYPELFTT